MPRSAIARFLRDRRGGVAVIVTLSIFVLVGALGLAIDSARGYTVQSKLQGAVDAAALAAAKVYGEGRTIGDMTVAAFAASEARMFFDSNYPNDFMGGEILDFDAYVDESSDNMVVRAKAAVPTTFMQALGIKQMSMVGDAQVKAIHSNLELSLVVDVTGSMNWIDSGGAVKIESLRAAGKALLQTIYADETSLPGVHVSLVPYRAAVNIGHRPSWLRGYNEGDFNPDSWRGCVLARAAPQDQNDDPPDKKADRFYPYHWPGGKAWNFWPPVLFDLSGPNWFCPKNEIIPLTDQRETIEDGIEALDARSGGGTQTSQGLVWGWRTVSPRWRGEWKNPTPNDMPKDYDEPNLVKAVVFMTDGIADIGWELMAYGFLDEGNLGTTNEAAAEAEINSRLSAVCESMKDEGIRIFSVMFAVTNPAIESTYRDCASEPDYFFNSPTGEELESAFEQIGRRLASLRLAH